MKNVVHDFVNILFHFIDTLKAVLMREKCALMAHRRKVYGVIWL